ncbi:phosphodiester glycosidase family protein [Caldanaerobius polysaccharolyticus]|uniref:phosphodiester glycosidase family protein n=1 Tax=Caldanaerobius polysaccharolyticus TaxID=44256 RepID=UPI000478CBE8|nr:phosphodiester glycosidase family protein [Caldanaerobius polysaccharolyticus]
MKKFILKSLLLVMASLMFTVNLKPAFGYSALDTRVQTEIVTEGVTRQYITKYTTAGWLYLSVLKVDLHNPYITLNAIFNDNKLSTKKTVLQMATTSGALAAVNGNFFDPASSNVPSQPIGVIISDNRIISYSDPGKDFATFSLTSDKIPDISLWNAVGLKVVAPDGTSAPIDRVNKFSDFNNITLYDRMWRDTTYGVSKGFPGMVEVIVDQDNTVVEVRDRQPPANIPVGGYVLASSNADKRNFLLKLKPGDGVKIQASPLLENLKTALGGGSMLVKEGKVLPPPSNKNAFPSYNSQAARTAIGYTQDKRYIILLVVDKSKPNSIGLTYNELAQEMKSLGAYNAMSFDGGGSSSMVARPYGDTELITVANGSQGNWTRPVVSGLGIFSTAPSSGVAKLVLKADDYNTYPGVPRTIKVVALDSHENPVNIDTSKITFNVQGSTGTMDGNVFTPDSPGVAVISAVYENISSSISINVLEDVAELKASSIVANPGQKKDVVIYAKDSRGKRAQLTLKDVNYKIYGDVGTVDGIAFIAGKYNRTGAISVEFMGYRLNIPVKVGTGSQFDSSQLPQATNFIDIDKGNREITDPDLKIAVIGQTKVKTLFDLLMLRNFIEEANKNNTLVVAMGDNESNLLKELNITPIVTTNKGSYTYGNSTFIVLNTSKGGIKDTDPAQWPWFKDQLQKVKTDNVFIVLPTNVWGTGGFKDPEESRLFEDVLMNIKNSGKNVWILQNGYDRVYTTVNDGIRYISTNGLSNSSLKNIHGNVYINIYVKGNVISYTVNPIFK